MVLVAQIIAGLIETYIFSIGAVSERTQSKTDILDSLSLIMLLINLVTTIHFRTPF